MRHIFAATMLVALSTAVFAQTTPLSQAQSAMQAQPVSVMVAGQQATILRAGTPVELKLTTELTTKGKHLKVGDRFSLEVAEPVMLNGQVVIPTGSNAVGEVTSVRNKGMWGKSGNIETRLLYLTANDHRIRLTGAVGDKGVKAGGGAVAVSALVFLPAGFFMTGTSAVLPPGTRVVGMLDEDVPVAFATPVVQPMNVPTRTAEAPVATPRATLMEASGAKVIPVSAKAN